MLGCVATVFVLMCKVQSAGACKDALCFAVLCCAVLCCVVPSVAVLCHSLLCFLHACSLHSAMLHRIEPCSEIMHITESVQLVAYRSVDSSVCVWCRVTSRSCSTPRCAPCSRASCPGGCASCTAAGCGPTCVLLSPLPPSS